MRFTRKYKQTFAIILIILWTHLELYAGAWQMSALNAGSQSVHVEPSSAEGAAYLFDRDVDTVFAPAEPVLVDVALSRPETITEIRVHGPASYLLTVRAMANGQWFDFEGLDELDLSIHEDRWNRYKIPQPVEAEVLRLQLTPVEPADLTGIAEIEIRSVDAHIPISNGKVLSALMDAGVEFDGIRGYDADYESGVIGPEEDEYVDFEDDNLFRFDMAFQSDDIARAYLTYDLSGLSHWIGAIRSVNDQPAMGGRVIEPGDGGRQIEEISPSFLRQGTNTVRFVPVAGVDRYEVSNVRILVELKDDSGEDAIDDEPGIGSALSALKILNGLDANPARADVDKNGRVGLEDAVAGLQIAAELREKPDGPLESETEDGKPAIILSYPDNGQYFGSHAYLRGFVSPADNGSGEVALFIGDREINHIFGEFETVADIDADENNTLELTAVYPDGETVVCVLTLEEDLMAHNGEIQVYSGNSPASDDPDADDDDPANQDDDPVETPEDSDVNALGHHDVNPDDDGNLVFEGAAVKMTPGAVKQAMRLSMMTLRDRDLPALDPGMVNVTGKFKGYRFLPHGMKFDKKVKVKLPYDKQKIPNGFGDEDVQTYFYDDATGRWFPLEREHVDTEAGEITSQTDHFTDMINAVVQVPESPQAASFNPTQMKDIKVANPAAKVNLIEPPRANNQGSANLSYPVEVPPGRMGMQPQVGVQYNSGGGNGWMGRGWDIPIQTITIDTRWGVPRYDADLETETYVLGGQQLTPLAHRETPKDRASEKIFHMRIEGGFQKIIRHGDHPANYRWEVIDKNGTHYYYGGDPASGGPAEDSTLADRNGNIATWALRLVMDSNGNTIRYRYVRQEDTGLAQGTVPGFELYLTDVFYTGYENQPGPYRVAFIRDRDLGEEQRPDVSIDCRFGFKKVTADLLRKIEVSFDGRPIRSYEFQYVEGEFKKTLLESVIQFDDRGREFNRHQFEYFNEARDESGNLLGFGSSEIWDAGDDDLSVGNMIFNREGSALGGTFNKNMGKHGFIGVSQNPGKQNAIGGKFGQNKSTNTGIAVFTDINGDSLPDKVYESGSKYRPNLSGPGGSPVFGPETDINLNGISVGKSDMVSGGVEAYINNNGFVGANLNVTFSETSVYLSDPNGDGITDLVRNGSVRFGWADPDSPDPEHPNPRYGANSHNTPNPIQSGEIDGEGLIDNFEELKDRMIDDCPLHDTFRRFLVPYDGFVRISGDARLIEDTSDDRREYKTADGVRVAIQHNGGELWSETIGEDDYSPKMPQGLDAIRVRRGDRIYFRVQSNFDGAWDQVKWDPRIEYLNVEPVMDADSRNPYVFQASEDFIVTGRSGIFVSVPLTGTLRVTGDVEKLSPTSDDIRIVVLHNETEAYSMISDSGQIETIPVDVPLNVEKLDRVTLKIEADSPVDLTQVNWKPHLEYTDAEGMDTVKDENGDPMITFDPPYVADVYGENDLDSPHPAWIAPESGVLRVEAHFMTPADSGEIVLTVKRSGELAGKTVLDFTKPPDIPNGPNGNNDRMTYGMEIRGVTVEAGDRLWFGLSTRDRPLGEMIDWYDIDAAYEGIDLFGDIPFGSPARVWTADRSGIIHIRPAIDTSATGGTVTLSVTRNGGQPVTETFDVSRADEIVLPVMVGENDLVSFDLGTEGQALAEAIQSYRININSGLAGEMDVPGALYFPAEEKLYSQPFRGWNVAAYNGNRERANEPIVESDLDDVSSGVSQYNRNRGVTDPDNLRETDSPEKAKAVVFYPEPAENRWRGYDDGSWVEADTVSSSRLNSDYPPIPEPGRFAGTVAVNLLSQSEQLGLAGSISNDNFPISGSGSGSLGWNKRLLGFQDMNGDRFPDVVGEKRIQYTLPTGALESSSREVISGISAGGTFSWSAGASGNFPEVENGKKGAMQMAPLGLNGNFSGSEDWQEFDLADINGDGLPDRVYQNGEAQLNLGYGFTEKEDWNFHDINAGGSLSFSIGGSAGMSSVPTAANDGRYGFGGGVGVSENRHSTEKAWIDINGDGLADYVRKQGGENHLLVGLNTGNGFTEITYPGIGGSGDFSKQVSTDQNAGAYFTISIPVTPLITAFWLIINPGADWNFGVSRPEVSIMDIDGDGYPDHLTAEKENIIGDIGVFNDSEITVRRNQIGRTNLLKKVVRPLGASFTIDYERDGNTYQVPQSRWNMSRVEVFDGVAGDGVDTLVTTFKYDGGLYHRREREFYGYRTVTTEQRNAADGDVLYRSTVQTFKNGNYYEKGLLESEVMRDAAGGKYMETVNHYRFRDVDSGNVLQGDAAESLTATVFPELFKTEKKFYEGQESPGIATYQTFEYDSLGNVTHFFDAADTGAADDVESLIEYHSDSAHYIMGKADKITVMSNGQVRRHREATIENGTGNLKQVRINLGSGFAVHDMAHDQYGNIAAQTGPANKNGQRYQLNYTYDSDVHTYVERIRDSFGYTSTASHDLRWGEITRTTDINGQSITTRLDDLGRVAGITGPYQQGTGIETITFEYHPQAKIPWALTRHYDNYEQKTDPIETVMFIDGLKRGLQTKKDGAVDTGNGTARDTMIVSGRVIFDFAGRAVEQYYPVSENLGNQGVFNTGFDNVRPTRTTYDVLDRMLTTTIPDNTGTTFAYGFGPDRDGVTRFQTTVTDANNKSKITYKDVRELITAVKEFNAGKTIITSYRYDPLRQITEVRDHAGNVTSVQYDLAGRRTHIDSPDMGLTESVFDPAGNVIRKITANLRAEGKAIEYDYAYSRLDGIRYPNYPENNVTYEYGPPGAPHNRANRPATVADASGVEELFYGPQGETVKTIKTVTSRTQGNNDNSPETYVTEYAWDTWNSMREMVYADGETLTYGYNAGGLVESVSGKKGDHVYPYLQALTYDKFEQRVYMKQGNGIETNYTHNPLNRRLSALKAKSKNRQFMDLAYQYDNVGNILGLDNLAQVKNPNDFGGATHFTYAYDDLYRLTGSTGTLEQKNTSHEYTLVMAYDDIHNIVSKSQQHVRVSAGGSRIEQKKTTYDNPYAYESAKPHAPTRIGDRTFTHDPNGNQTGFQSEINGTRREMIWDEENRIREIVDNGRSTTFKYNAAGERVFKTGTHGETVYVNQFYTVGNREQGSKHVFVGSTRIATKLVKGQENVTTPASNNGNPGAPNPPGNAYGHDKNDNNAGGNGNGNSGNNGGGSGGGPPGNGSVLYEPDVFYYHPDHLGSTSYVTDVSGEVYQHLEYFPFGETWVEEVSNQHRVPYLFTAKELDRETGLYYFGARYYDPRTSVWQSCDPILGDYLNGQRGMGGVFNSMNTSLYIYSHQNPIKYIDPNGMNPEVAIEVLKNSSKLKSKTKEVLRPGLIRGIYAAESIATSAIKRIGEIFGIGNTVGRGQVGNKELNLVRNNYSKEFQAYAKKLGRPDLQLPENFRDLPKEQDVEDFVVGAYLAFWINECNKAKREGRSKEDSLSFGIEIYHGENNFITPLQNKLGKAKWGPINKYLQGVINYETDGFAQLPGRSRNAGIMSNYQNHAKKLLDYIDTVANHK